MLTIVWRAEYFRNYILGRSFTVITDHKALISLLNGNNKKIKTLFSRITRWLDRFIPLDFVKNYKPGAKIGFADYLSRHPREPPKPIRQYDNLFTVNKLNSIRKSLGFKVKYQPLGKRNRFKTQKIGSNQSIRDSSNQNRERETCMRTSTVEGGKSCTRKLTNKNRSISYRIHQQNPRDIQCALYIIPLEDGPLSLFYNE